jgi:AraC family transcriptional regulator
MLHQLEPGSYFGATRHLYDSGGLTVAESAYPAQFLIPPHEHVNSFFCFVLEGEGTRSWPGRAGAERPMALTLFPRGHAHANFWTKPGKVLHVEFASPWLERLRDRSDVLDRPGDFEGGPPTWLARRLADECRTPDSTSHLMVEGLTLELLAECTRCPDKNLIAPRRWLESARAVVRERFAESLSLCEIAAAVGVSADHLARVFRRCYGCTVGDYVRGVRVEFACARLTGSDLPLAELAIAAGFADQSHFTKVFRRQMGETPAAFRARHRRRRFLTRR